MERSGEIGTFLIVSEGSAAAGIRRIEAITGREAYAQIQRTNSALAESARVLKSAQEGVPQKVKALQKDFSAAQKELAALKRDQAKDSLEGALEYVPEVAGVPVLTAALPGAMEQLLARMRRGPS